MLGAVDRGAEIDFFPPPLYDDHMISAKGGREMDRQLCETAAEELRDLVARHTEISEKGFAVDLREETERWLGAIRAAGAKKAYRLIGRTLCELYERRFGKPYLFSEECLAFEIAYHANAYFWARGTAGFARHLTTRLFSREALLEHCEVIDISTDDTAARRQRLMFGYARGVRPCYRNTEQDPFDRSTLAKRIAGSRKRK